MSEYKPNVKEWKLKAVDELVDLINKHKVVGVIDLTSLPSSQLQSIRGAIRDSVIIKCSKKSLISRALEKTGHTELLDSLKGSPALIFSNENPYKVYKLIEKNKSKSPIKPGQIAPHDLIVPAGDTPFAPGPIIGELGSIGVKAKIMGGKITVLKDAVVVKAGEPASETAATILTKLGIKPIEIGLNLVAIEEEGVVYPIEQLSIDIESLIAQAYVHARNLVLNTGIVVPSMIEDIIAYAHTKALILNGVVHPEQKVEAPATEEKKEEKKEEPQEEESGEVSEEDIAQGMSGLFGM